jgi:hypothetical protein
VVFDTSRPTMLPPPNLAAPVVAEANPPQQTVAAPNIKGQVREAYAQLRPNPEPKRKRKALARSDVGPPTMLVAQQPHFGLFSNNVW